MNKKEFLNRLKKRLSILKESEIEDIIEEYEGHINEKIASGKTEKEAIKDFGDFDLLVKDILSAYKINEEYENVKNEKNVVVDFIESFVSFIKDFADNMARRSKDDIIRFIVEFIVLIIFISIMKIPVLFISELGEWLFEKLISPFGDGLATIWKFMIEVIYLILVIVGIVNFVKKRYMEGEIKEKTVSLEKEEKKNNEVIKKEKIKKEEKERKNKSSFTKLIITILKICLIFVIIPALFSFAASFACLIFGIILLIQGVPYLGILLCLLTYVSLNYIFLDLCFRFIFNKKINLKALLISIITTVILFAVAIGLSLHEVVNTTYINGVPSKYNKVIKEKKESYSESVNLTCNSLHHTSCSYEIDDTLGNDIIATVTYYDFNKNFEITDDLEYVRLENEEYSLKEIYDIVIGGLRQRKIYNYNELAEVKVKIKVSSDVMKKIEQSSYHDDDYYDYDSE